MRAARYMKEIHTPVMYMEQRLYQALNLVNAAARYPSKEIFPELYCGFGYSAPATLSIVIWKAGEAV